MARRCSRLVLSATYRPSEGDLRKISVAVIGLGAAAQPHSMALQSLSERVDVVVAATRSAERAAEYRSKFSFPVTTDIQKAIEHPEVEVALVLTPPATHLDLAQKLFSAGKHVLVEKPLELTTKSAEQIVEAASKAGRKLGVVLQHRFRSASLHLASLLRDHALGEVEAASVAVPWWRPQSYYDVSGRGTRARDGGGVLLTQAIHSLDLFRSLVGVSEIRAVEVRTTGIHRMETEDYVAALVRTDSGAPGVITATTAAYPGGIERIDIICRKATVQLRGAALKISWHGREEEVLGSDEPTGGGASIMDFSPEAHRAVIEDFLIAVEQNREPLASGLEALKTQKLIEMLLAEGVNQP